MKFKQEIEIKKEKSVSTVLKGLKKINILFTTIDLKKLNCKLRLF